MSGLRALSTLGDEQMMFIDGSPYQWNQLPRPDLPLTVGIDGGYVHARNGDNRKAGWFEVIVGKSMQGNSALGVFALNCIISCHRWIEPFEAHQVQH